MPELPEVEAVRRSLLHAVVGRRVLKVDLRRPDIVTGDTSGPALLQSCVLTDIQRHGKELSLLGERDQGLPRCVCVHLGMSGSLRVAAAGHHDRHVHVTWLLDDGSALEFRDPRRFGGVWPFACTHDRDALRWSLRGRDALAATIGDLCACLPSTRRAIKAVLLDQSVVAGVGNIYADELLFAARVHPLTPGRALTVADVRRIVTTMRRVLTRAIEAGGSTLGDGTYVDGQGRPGDYQRQHAVYGRGGLPCRRCRKPLESTRVSGRTTVFCPRCQRVRFL